MLLALNDFITEAEIGSTIKAIKSDKSCGYDEKVNEYIASTKHFMLLIYASLFNIILDSGNIQSDWTRRILYYQVSKTREVNASLLTTNLQPYRVVLENVLPIF